MSETKIDCSDIRNSSLMLYSLPRVTFSGNFRSAMAVSATLGLDMYTQSSAFWSVALERALAQAMDMGKEFALTVDYDTVFTVNNVLHLYALMKSDPGIDSVSALQVKRGDESYLLCKRDENGEFQKTIDTHQFSEELLRVHQAHFGLTFIRLSALKDIPRPWFLRTEIPGKTDESLDDDIYFWRQWEKYNKSCYIACHNSVGHLQEVVTWPDKDMIPRHQLWGDFEKHGRPMDARGIDRHVQPKAEEIPLLSEPVTA